MAYSYTPKLLRIAGSRVSRSDFDEKLCSRWDAAMRSGVFRYDLNQVQAKSLEGPNNYQALLNTKRATDRRPAEPMQSVDQPFDPSKFNFNKVKSEEILFTIQHEGRSAPSTDKMIINVSPADYGHSLITPETEMELNQNLTMYAVQLALEVMCLSSSSSFKIGFNSLCAHASVNHQHLHCFYTDMELAADIAQGVHLQSGLHELASDAPRGYGFELHNIEDIPLVSRLVFSCANRMKEMNIAHCMFMCRGCSFTDPNHQLIKVILWPCTKVLGTKARDSMFYRAAFEMAGLLLMYDATHYDTMTDSVAYEHLKGCSLPDKEFTQLTAQLLQILTLQAN